MNRSRIATLALLFASQFSVVAHAQDMSFGLDESEAEAEAGGDEGTSSGTDMEFGTDEGEGEGDDGGGLDLIGELAEEDDADVLAEGAAEAGPKPTEVVEEIYAVQQIYALRKKRIEILPMFGMTVNDPYSKHPSVGAGLNYWITNVLAVGANFNWYQGFEAESDLDFQVRRATRLATRPTSYQVGFWGNFTYVPLYGKFAFFNKKIFQWDAYVIGGAGAIRTKPIPVVDPEYRYFDYAYRMSFDLGIGLRIFLSKWLTVFVELRDYMYLEKLENLDVSLDGRDDPSTWLEPDSSLENNFTVQVGLTIFIPFKFEYKLPK